MIGGIVRRVYQCRPRDRVGYRLRCHLHDTLHDGRSAADFAGDAQDAAPPLPQFADACLYIGPDWLTPEPLALRLGTSHARLHTLLNHRAPRWRCCVDSLLMQVQVRTGRFEFPERGE